MEADGLVYPVAEAVADLEVLGGEPAAHPFVLKAGIKSVRKLLVFGGVGDEAGVELDRLQGCYQGRDLSDKRFRQAADKVVEAARPLQHLLREARKVGVRASVNVFIESQTSDGPRSRVTLSL